MTRLSDHELQEVLERPGYRVREGNAQGEIDTESRVADDGVAAGPDGSDVRSSGRGGKRPGVATPIDPRVAPQATLLELRTLRFVLPMPPSCNELYGVGKNGQKYLLDEQREFRTRVISLVRRDMRLANDRAPLLGRVCLTAHWHFPDYRVADISNRWKALEDALAHAGALRNDSQIDEQHGYRIVGHGEMRCEVVLQEIAA